MQDEIQTTSTVSSLASNSLVSTASSTLSFPSTSTIPSMSTLSSAQQQQAQTTHTHTDTTAHSTTNLGAQQATNPTFGIPSAPPIPNAYYPFALPSRVHLPPFNKSDPSLWFITVEEQFNLAGITHEDGRYANIINSLPGEIALQVRDLITNKPLVLPYTTLKNLLIQRLSASLDERIHQLLQKETLGSQRPTQLLVRMNSLMSECTGMIDGNVFRSLFLQRMPRNVQEILSVLADTTSVQSLAQMADKIIETSNRNQNSAPINSVHAAVAAAQPSLQPALPQHAAPAATAQPYPVHTAVTHTPHTVPNSTTPSLPQTYSAHHASQTHPHNYLPTQYINSIQNTPQLEQSVNAISPSQATFDSLVKSVQQLSLQVETLVKRDNNRGRSRSRNSSQQRSRSSSSRRRSRSPDRHNNPNYCFYHNRFGKKARKCYTDNCTYSSENP